MDISWSELEEMEYSGGAESHADDSYRVEMLLKELVEELEKSDPGLARIVTLSFIGYGKDEIFEDIGVKKSQGYDLWKEAERLTREFLFG